jgi:hypothetical protein
VGTLDDLARVLNEARLNDTKHVIRVTLHPADFVEVQRSASAAFASAPSGPTQVACRGHLWGIAVFVDPRNEKNIAYVVTKEGDAQKGTPYELHAGPDTRRTAWARLMGDDEICPHVLDDDE